MNAVKTRRVGAALLAAAAAVSLTAGQAWATSGLSTKKIQPTPYAGNFVASDDDQVCYELTDLGLIGPVTAEMRGLKIDPPTSFANDHVSVTISADGKNLAWETRPGATMLGIIVKGGTNYNLYNYVGTGLTSDSGLHSPATKKNVPQISHYNVCYRLSPVVVGDEGCTPGYWKNHADRWLGAAPVDDFDVTFGVDAFNPNITLGVAIGLNGGGINALARHATAALLNSYGGVPNADGERVDYPLTTAQVIAEVKAAIVSDNPVAAIEATKDRFADMNELGCNLEETKVVKV